MSYQRLSKKREQEEVQTKDHFQAIMEENNKLHEELRQMVGRKHPLSHVRGEAEGKLNHLRQDKPDDSHRRNDTALSFGGSRRGEISDKSKRSEVRENMTEYSEREGEESNYKHERKMSRNVTYSGEESKVKHNNPDTSDKLRETIDALEYMKKREKSLQEEVKSLSQVVLR